MKKEGKLWGERGEDCGGKRGPKKSYNFKCAIKRKKMILSFKKHLIACHI